MSKLTKRIVEAASAKPKDVFLWDGEIRGFGVRVKSTGTKTFILQYRNAENRSRRIALGKFGPLTVDEARKRAVRALADVYEGQDPAEDKRRSREGDTVRDICEWYLREARAGRILGRMRRAIKSSTLDMDESRIRTHILPLIGNRKISALRRADIERFQSDVIAGRTAKPREKRGGQTTGGPGVGSRAVGTLHAIFEHAIRFGLIEANPASGVRRHSDTRKDRRLSLEEIARLGAALKAAENQGEHPTAISAIRFALLTGFRRLEVLSLERSWLDFDTGVVRFPSTKTGAQVRVVGEPALTITRSQLQQHNSSFVFPAAIGAGHFVGAPRVLARITERAQIEGVTLHVLRHTYASVAADLGYSELTIRALLGHASRGVTQRYVHVDAPLRAAAETTATEIATALNN